MESKKTELKEKTGENQIVYLSELGSAIFQQVFQRPIETRIKEEYERLAKYQGDTGTPSVFKMGVIYGWALAYHGLATCYKRGLGVEQSNKKGREILSTAPSKNMLDCVDSSASIDAPALEEFFSSKVSHHLKQYQFADVLFFLHPIAAMSNPPLKKLHSWASDLEIESRFNIALPCYRVIAVKGGASEEAAAALNDLINCYKNGKKGLEQNVATAEKLQNINPIDQVFCREARILELTADIEERYGCLGLKPIEQGHYYIQGEVSHQEKAVKYYELAAKTREANEAFFFLGLCYLHGIGVKPDAARAISFLKEAMAGKFKAAQYVLAWCCQLGIGVEENAKLAQSIRETELGKFNLDLLQDSKPLSQEENDSKFSEKNYTVAPFPTPSSSPASISSSQNNPGCSTTASSYSSLNASLKINPLDIEMKSSNTKLFSKSLAERVVGELHLSIQSKIVQGGSKKVNSVLRLLDQDLLAYTHHSEKEAIAESIFQEGERYKLEKNGKEAFMCYQDATNEGSLKAKIRRGSCYANGEGVTRDKGKANRIFDQVFEKIKEGDSEALLLLGNSYLKCGDTKAEQCFFRAAVQGCRPALLLLITEERVKNKEKKEKNQKNSIIVEKLEALARMWDETWDSTASFLLLQLTQHKFPSEALIYQAHLTLLANASSPNYQKEAKKLYQAAADLNSAEGHYFLGILYVSGPEPKFEEAIPHFKQAAIQGHASAITLLAYCLDHGLGVPCNKEIAQQIRIGDPSGNESVLNKLKIKEIKPKKKFDLDNLSASTLDQIDKVIELEASIDHLSNKAENDFQKPKELLKLQHEISQAKELPILIAGNLTAKINKILTPGAFSNSKPRQWSLPNLWRKSTPPNKDRRKSLDPKEYQQTKTVSITPKPPN